MKLNRLTALVLALMILLAAGGSALAREEKIWQVGDTGETVTEMQDQLRALGYLDREPTGAFDAETESALLRFQQCNGLLATGMGDRQTLALLFSEEAIALEPQRGKAALYEEEVVDGGFYDASFSVPAAGFSMTAASVSSVWAPEAEWNTNEYGFFTENGFVSAAGSPLSTFAADVDTASYAQIRSLILQGKNVPPDAVRVEEMINYFRYDYPHPEDGHPFGVSLEMAPCPWNPETLLLQVGLQAKEIRREDRSPQNLVFLIDVSGSMFGADRLDLVKRAFMLLLEELDPSDTVSLVTYASRDEVLLRGVPAADKVRIMEVISSLEAGGSTNSAAGIQTAYHLAEEFASEGSANRILMATDGDFNVGLTSEGDLARLVMEKKQAGIRLTMLGVGYGNYKDNKLEALADYGDGNYYYLDTIYEARRALVAESGGILEEVARDVKLQLDFNPAKVSSYRLIGYEDRLMDARDFADDAKDGGEVGSGHRVTALYEIVPVGSAFDPGLPAGRYGSPAASAVPEVADTNSDWLTLAIRYKAPGEETSVLEEFPFRADPTPALSDNMKWAAAVAECAMLLRESPWRGDASWEGALALARDCADVSGDAYREEFVYLLTLLHRSASR
ncbi:MAG: von Willebrand factor type A domain-containing protein [Clostridia bacterium]|nr:von Willebrand factor type A domain-containing protein [Clostridia bacterium]